MFCIDIMVGNMLNEPNFTLHYQDSSMNITQNPLKSLS